MLIRFTKNHLENVSSVGCGSGNKNQKEGTKPPILGDHYSLFNRM